MGRREKANLFDQIQFVNIELQSEDFFLFAGQRLLQALMNVLLHAQIGLHCRPKRAELFLV